jgi:hypothetical protein
MVFPAEMTALDIYYRRLQNMTSKATNLYLGFGDTVYISGTEEQKLRVRGIGISYA